MLVTRSLQTAGDTIETTRGLVEEAPVVRSKLLVDNVRPRCIRVAKEERGLQFIFKSAHLINRV
eukprot:941945-Prorocentrum_minimum.AAC.4